jgi:hypothetical protein
MTAPVTAALSSPTATGRFICLCQTQCVSQLRVEPLVYLQAEETLREEGERKGKRGSSLLDCVFNEPPNASIADFSRGFRTEEKAPRNIGCSENGADTWCRWLRWASL